MPAHRLTFEKQSKTSNIGKANRSSHKQFVISILAWFPPPLHLILVHCQPCHVHVQSGAYFLLVDYSATTHCPHQATCIYQNTTHSPVTTGKLASIHVLHNYVPPALLRAYHMLPLHD
jgi:hypothetical protein